MLRIFFVVTIFTIATGLALQVEAEQKTYHGYKVLRASVSTAEQLRFLSKLRDESNFDFWSGPEMGGHADIMSSTGQILPLQNILESNGISYSVMISDVESVVMEVRKASLAVNETGMHWNDYQSLETIYNWLEELERNYTSVEIIDIGKSTENRTLKVVKISKPSNVTKPAIWIDGTIHAREFISTSTVTFAIHKLLTNANSSLELLDSVDFYFLPVMNVDGYEYARNVDRLWRKSRSLQANSSCVGVDLNRNFGFHFGEEGSSSDKCSITYSGETEFSDPESRAVRDYASSIPNLKVFITTHSYSQLFMTPWGYSTDFPENYNEMLALANKAVAAIKSHYGTTYRTGSSANILYKSAGTSRDWAKGVLNTTFVYTVELRDTGDYGFVLPPEQIIPTGEETFSSFLVVSQEVAKRY